MSSLVVDTDVISFLFKNHPMSAQSGAVIKDHILVISFMTLAELDRWAIQSRWGDATPPPVMGVQVTPKLATPLPRSADAWIAATASLYNLPLVTHNRSDYRGVPGLQIISHGG